MLRLSVSQETNEVPYIFNATGTRVYSFEEALFYVYNNWRLTADDFLCDAFTKWLKDIGLSYLSTKVAKLALEKSFSKKILTFLGLSNFFDESELETAANALSKWEARRDYENLKERADFFVRRGEPGKAIPLYTNAISFDENVSLYNNLGVAYMQLGMYKNAFETLQKASLIQPKNTEVLFALSEAAINAGFLEEAKLLLERCREEITSASPVSSYNKAKLTFLLGELAWKEKKHKNSITHLQEAISQSGGNPHFIYSFVKKLTSMRQFETALKTLGEIEEKNHEYYVNEANVHAVAMDLPKAIKSLKQAISLSEQKSAALYTKLAEYTRKDYNLSGAELWIIKALECEPDNEIAKLEYAKIKKAQGKSRDYQMSLGEILEYFKKRSRINSN